MPLHLLVNARAEVPIEIRGMTEGDADGVRGVERAAFAAHWNPGEGGRAERPPRTRTNVLVRLRKDPGGCFVAVAGGEIVGIAFTRTWGLVGWCGSLAVDPLWQGKGIGSRLLQASLGYLRRDPRRIAGLETGAGEAGSVNLYLRSGLVPCPVTLQLSKQVDKGHAPEATERWSTAGASAQAQWLGSLREAAGSVIPGLDYTKEIESAVDDGLGETCVAIEGGRAVGLGVVTVESPYEGWGSETAIVQALVIDRSYTSDARLLALLAGVEAVAGEAGCNRLLLVVSAARRWTVERLLRCGYRLERVGLQMVLADGPPLDIDPEGVDCSRWAG